MSALDDARAVLAETVWIDFEDYSGGADEEPAQVVLRRVLEDLVGECEADDARREPQERVELGELLVRAVEAHGGLFVDYFKAEKEWFVAEPGSDLNGQHAPTLTDALAAFLARVEDE